MNYWLNLSDLEDHDKVIALGMFMRLYMYIYDKHDPKIVRAIMIEFLRKIKHDPGIISQGAFVDAVQLEYFNRTGQA